MGGCSALTIDKDVTIKTLAAAPYAISVYKDMTASPVITVKGTLDCGDCGIYVNGNVTLDNAPTINVDGATITAKDAGLYLAGPANTTVTGSTITSENVGIEVREIGRAHV